METEIIKIRPGDGPVSEEDEEKLRAAGAILQQGGLVAFPTETVYGLGGDALNPSSSQKIYAAKGRPSDNPLIVHIYRFEDIYKITKEVPEEARKIADAFWPGPLTMILPKSDAVPYETTGGLDTVAIRMPSHPAAQKLIKYSGGYIAAPSANTSGKPSPTVAKYVEEDMMGRIDAIIDGVESEKIGALFMDAFPGEEGIIHIPHDEDIIRTPGMPYFKLKYLRSFVNVIHTPHMAFFTEEAGRSMALSGIDGIYEVLTKGSSAHEIPQ